MFELLKVSKYVYKSGAQVLYACVFMWVVLCPCSYVKLIFHFISSPWISTYQLNKLIWKILLEFESVNLSWKLVNSFYFGHSLLLITTLQLSFQRGYFSEVWTYGKGKDKLENIVSVCELMFEAQHQATLYNEGFTL